MLQGTTPTLILTLPDSIDPASVSAVRVDIVTNDGQLLARLDETEPALTTHDLIIELTEAQTMSLPAGLILIQTRIEQTDGTITGFRTLPHMVRQLYNREPIRPQEAGA